MESYDDPFGAAFHEFFRSSNKDARFWDDVTGWTNKRDEQRTQELKVVSETLHIKYDKCQNCQVVELRTQKEVYNYRSNKFGVWILGCHECWWDDSDKIVGLFKEFVLVPESSTKEIRIYERVK